MLQRSVLLFIIVLIGGFVNAQKEPLERGDKVPNILLENILNYRNAKLKMSDFKGKLLIIDFWNKYCSNCIAGFPKLEMLQNKYKNKIQILLVTRNKKEELKNLFQHSIDLKSNTLPMILGDTILHNLFPHVGQPFMVWIDKDGIFRSKSDEYGATEKNISIFLSDHIPTMKYYEAEFDFNTRSPLILEGGGRQWNKLQFYSMLMKGIVGINSSSALMKTDTLNNRAVTILRMTNSSPIGLFRFAYEPNTQKTIVEAEQSNFLFLPKDKSEINAWRDTTSYSYELLIAQEQEKDIRRIMKRDLELQFGLSGFVEKRKIPCFILKSNTNIDLLRSKDSDYKFEITDHGVIIKNSVMADLTGYLKFETMGTVDEPCIIDETNFTGKISIELSSALSNLKDLNEELKKYGLFIYQEERFVNCFVLKSLNINR